MSLPWALASPFPKKQSPPEQGGSIPPPLWPQQPCPEVFRDTDQVPPGGAGAAAPGDAVPRYPARPRGDSFFAVPAGIVRRTKPAREEHPAKSPGKQEERETQRANEPYKRLNPPPRHMHAATWLPSAARSSKAPLFSLSSAQGSAGEAAARIWAANANNTDVLTIRLFLQLKTKDPPKPNARK